MEILVRSRVDLQVKQTWSHLAGNGLDNGEPVIGSIALLRDRLDLAVENEEVWFVRQYWSAEETQSGLLKARTNRRQTSKVWQSSNGLSAELPAMASLVKASGASSPTTQVRPTLPNPKTTSHTSWSTRCQKPSMLHPASSPAGRSMALGVLLMALLIGGLIYYQRAQERRQVQALQGYLDRYNDATRSKQRIHRCNLRLLQELGEALQAIRLHEEGLRNDA